MGLRIIYLDTAIRDLQSIYNYISADSKKYALLEVKKIRSFIEALIIHPLKGKYYGIIKNKEVRTINFRNYIIFYHISETDLNILTVHHHSRLISNNPALKG